MVDVQPFLYAAVFAAGLIIGRISMAVQYSYMKKYAKEKL